MIFRQLIVLVAAGLFLAACGGGGGGGSTNTPIIGSQQPPLNANSVLLSDMLVSGQGFTEERVTGIFCTPDISRCRATYRGRTFTFGSEADSDADADGTIFTTLGTWNHMRVAAIHVSNEGLQARFAVLGGVTHANSLLSGSATWNGEMVALDSNNRVIRGDASLTIANFNNPSVDVRLTPDARVHDARGRTYRCAAAGANQVLAEITDPPRITSRVNSTVLAAEEAGGPSYSSATS